MKFTEKLLAMVNATISEALNEIPQDAFEDPITLLTEEDLDGISDEQLEYIANMIFAALVLPKIYGEPDGPNPVIEEALANTPSSLALVHAVESLNEAGMDGDLSGTVGPELSVILRRILVYELPNRDGLIWSPQLEEGHLVLANGTPGEHGLPISKEDVATWISADFYETTPEVYQRFCDIFTMAFNQLHDLEMLSGLLVGMEVAHTGDGRFLLILDDSL